ncbi:MAG: GAF domain-containing protein [Deltaproteobacteria bacterium]|nr:GAF domain-containing protein [Deltaproteobacteria bacterium]
MSKGVKVTSWKKLGEQFPRWGGGIRGRLLWVGLFFLAAALLTNTIAGSIYTRRQIKKTAAALQAEVASRVAREIGDFMRRKMDRLSDLSATLSLRELGSEEQRLSALLLLKNDHSFTDISILDDKGMEVVKVSERRVYLPSELADQSASEKFKRVIKGKGYVSPVYTSDKAEPYVTMAVPVKVTPQLVVGVVTAEANLKVFWEVIGEVEFGKAGYAYLVDGQGKLIAHQDASLVLKRTNLSHLGEIQEFLRNPAAVDATPASESIGITGKPVLSTHALVPDLGWAVILEEPVDAAWAELRRMERYAYLLLGLGLLVGAAIIVWASSKITRPIRELHRGAEIIGKGNLDYRVEVSGGDEIEQLAQEFNKMATELKASYATLEQKVEQRTKELSVLYDVTATVNQSLEIEPVLQEVIRKITEIFNFDTMRLYLFDGQMEVLHVRAAHPGDRQDLPRVRAFRRGQGIVGKVAETGEPMIFEDILSDSRYRELTSTKNTRATGFRFFAAVPIKSKFKTVGVFICNGQTPRRLTSDEVRLVTSMAEQIGVAVEHARLFQEVARKSQELQALVEINKGIAALLDREVLLPRIAEEARNLLKVDGANFRLIEGEYLVLAGESGSENLSLRPRLRLDESLSGKVVQENRAVAVRDFLEDPTIIEAHRETMRKAGHHSFLGVPLRVAGRIIGTINLYSKEEREFRPEEINPITSFADQAAIAIQNANLFAEVKQKTVELEGANREIVEASRAKSEFLAAMSHELRTPLNVIIGNADLIKEGFFGDITVKQREALEKIQRYSQVLLKLINDVLSLTRIGAKRMALDISTFRLEDVVGQIQGYAEQLNQNNHIEVLWHVGEHLPPISSDALKLEEILQNLIGNAFKFTREGKIEIRVRDLPERGRVELSVADTGIGIDPEALDKIFEEFYQLRDAHTGSFSGVGLGLSIVKRYIGMIQGDIRVESQPKQGSTFTFTLPYSISPPAS